LSPSIISARAINYNVGVAESSNQLLLLNALRASQRMPTYYSHLASDTSGVVVTPSYQGAGPVGRDVAKKGLTYLATLTGSSQDQLTLATLDDQKFMRGVLTPVPLDVLGFFLNQGWPPELLFSMTISKISTTKGEVNDLIQSFENDCRANPGGDYCDSTVPEGTVLVSAGSMAPGPASQQYPPLQQHVSQQLVACIAAGALSTDPLASRASESALPITFENYPPDKQQTACFQWALRVIIALDPQLKSTSAEEVVARNVPNGVNPGPAIVDLLKSDFVVAPGTAPDSYTICKKTKVSGLTLERFKAVSAAGSEGSAAHGSEGAIQAFAASGPTVTTHCDQASPAAAAEGATSAHGALKLQLTTRSLDGMVYFLGEDVRSAGVVSAGSGEAAKIWVWNSREKKYNNWDLFDVRRGVGPIGVTFMGEIYSVPPACPGAANCPDLAERHTSFQAIALLNQVWGLQKEEMELPISPVVTVVNP
jgi:hypothetical protein